MSSTSKNTTPSKSSSVAATRGQGSTTDTSIPTLSTAVSSYSDYDDLFLDAVDDVWKSFKEIGFFKAATSPPCCLLLSASTPPRASLRNIEAVQVPEQRQIEELSGLTKPIPILGRQSFIHDSYVARRGHWGCPYLPDGQLAPPHHNEFGEKMPTVPWQINPNYRYLDTAIESRRRRPEDSGYSLSEGLHSRQDETEWQDEKHGQRPCGKSLTCIGFDGKSEKERKARSQSVSGKKSRARGSEKSQKRPGKKASSTEVGAAEEADSLRFPIGWKEAAEKEYTAIEDIRREYRRTMAAGEGCAIEAVQEHA